jgi:uncharacterized repeat protein (TIGR04076 family)
LKLIEKQKISAHKTYKSLVGFAAGGNYGMWYERKDVIIACCTDGTRPVIFKIEKIEE